MERYFKRKLCEEPPVEPSLESSIANQSNNNHGNLHPTEHKSEASDSSFRHLASNTDINDENTSLGVSVDVIRLMLKQGFLFGEHDEYGDSSNEGIFLGLINLLAKQNGRIQYAGLDIAREKLIPATPTMQRSIVRAIANETLNEVVKQVRDDVFTLMLDGSYSVPDKDYMAVILRYIDKKGEIVEGFLGLVNPIDAVPSTFMIGIENIFSKVGLNINQLRGQGYNGTSNMSREFKEVKELIMKENPYAYHIHCFDYELQSVIISVAQQNIEVGMLFHCVCVIKECIGGSCKDLDADEAFKLDSVSQELKIGSVDDRSIGRSFGAEWARNTNWGANYDTIVNFIKHFPSIVDALEIVMDCGEETAQRSSAYRWLGFIPKFDFVFTLYLMELILGKVVDLSDALGRKDIRSAIDLVEVSIIQLNRCRNEESAWEDFLQAVYSFCAQHNIGTKRMEDIFMGPKICSSSCQQNEETNFHHYRLEIFNCVIDSVLSDLNDRFSEKNKELLLCVSCLDPSNNFAFFDKKKVMQLARFYPCDFSNYDISRLEHQLDNFVMDMREHKGLQGISEVVKMLTQQKKHDIYFLVYRLLKLAMLLPIATAGVERVLASTNTVNHYLQDTVSDEFFSDCLVAYIEHDIASNLDNKTIIQRLKNMQTLTGHNHA